MWDHPPIAENIVEEGNPITILSHISHFRFKYLQCFLFISKKFSDLWYNEYNISKPDEQPVQGVRRDRNSIMGKAGW